jgi:hypothetical protein
MKCQEYNSTVLTALLPLTNVYPAPRSGPIISIAVRVFN